MLALLFHRRPVRAGIPVWRQDDLMVFLWAGKFKSIAMIRVESRKALFVDLRPRGLDEVVSALDSEEDGIF